LKVQQQGTEPDMRKFRYFMFSVLFLVSAGANSAPPQLETGHPDSYVVKPGDTLWDIAGMFLRDPWRWKEIWQGNPEVSNPDLIYPGDLLRLTYENGVPRLGVDNGGGPRHIKLTPTVRRESLSDAIHTIPIDAVQQFLTRPKVMDEADLEAAARVIGFVDEHIVGGRGDLIYVNNIDGTDFNSFDVVRIHRTYTDPDTGELLGTEALYVGDADLLRPGEPAKMVLSATDLEVQIDDRVFPDPQDEVLENFQPKAAPAFLEGKILSVLNGVNQIGVHNVVVLNKGGDDGLEPGDVMQIMQKSRPPKQITEGNGLWRRAPDLPLEDVGLTMVFRIFDRVSYALVLRAGRTVYVGDTVRSPEG